jgi:hypothetical protein
MDSLEIEMQPTALSRYWKQKKRIGIPVYFDWMRKKMYQFFWIRL